MAIRQTASIDEKKYKLPNYDGSTKMIGYEIFFDAYSDNKPRCGFYTSTVMSKLDGKLLFKHIITTADQYRMDLVALKYYKTTTYSWILEDINNIKDPIKDLTPGREIYIVSELDIMGAI